MNISVLASQLGENASAFLTSECAIALGAFLSGYKDADASITIALKELLVEIPGPDAANGCTRAYLANANPVMGFRAAMRAFESVLNRLGPISPEPGLRADRFFIDSVAEVMRRGRPAMLLGETTVLWMSDYFNGFFAGLDGVSPSEASKQRNLLNGFEAWLRQTYEAPNASWQAILRVNEGVGERGIKRFVELWSEFEAELRKN